MDLDVFNWGWVGCGLKIVEGMVLCIELMVIFGMEVIVILDDEWIVVMVDGLWVSYWENIVVVISKGLWVLLEFDGGQVEFEKCGVLFGFFD